jgi:hypothetical protein
MVAAVAAQTRTIIKPSFFIEYIWKNVYASHNNAHPKIKRKTTQPPQSI